jgi:hypothetical protein
MAECPYHKGYTEFDWSCSPLPTTLSDIAVLLPSSVFAGGYPAAPQPSVYGTIAHRAA